MTPLTVAEYAADTVHSIGIDRTLAEAQRLMQANHIRHLPVLEGKRLVGMVTERDLYMVEALDGVDPETMPVEEAMSQAPYIVKAKTPLIDAALYMWSHKIGSAVVMDGDQVVGVFTRTNALQALIELLARGARPLRRHLPRETVHRQEARR